MGNSKIVYYGETLIDLTGDTVEAAKLRNGITAHDKKGEKITGTLADVAQATPAITVDAAGKITASATQAAGVVAAGTKSATKQLTVQAAKTVTPSASAQNAVAKGVFTTGIITVAAVYAVIGVTYPSGSTVTCTNGSKTLKAKDTSGKAMFIVPTKGTWTVKAVKGSQSASKAVSITAEGQVETVELVYDYIIYSGNTKSWNGEYQLTPLSSSWGAATIQNDEYPPYFGGSTGKGGRLNNVINLTEYSQLVIDCQYTGNQWYAFGLIPYSGASSETQWVGSPGTTGMVVFSSGESAFARKIQSFDISKLTGDYVFKGEYYSDSNAQFRIYDFRLKR